MTHSIEIDDKSYVPLAAVPYVTGGFFGLSTAAKMISDPESYCDANHSTVLSAYQVTDDGRLVPAPYYTFQSLAALGLDGFSPAPSGVIAGVVVLEESLRCLYRTVSGELSDAGKLDRARHRPYWDLRAVLPDQTQQEISETILKPIRRKATRVNSMHARVARFRDVVGRIERAAIAAGIPFDRHKLPGRKRDFLRLVSRLDPSATVSSGSFDRRYAAALDLRWRQGSKPLDAAPLLALSGLTVDT